ncbi:MAG: hypothetical protein IT298_00775 [Chloroflexi bacterium]|jgi:hypothetical protein|nr:hypothetical protein [Chloroflexota bacterium]OQY86882.1 MAG: hypothetical protein B6D42_00320 [Anaerolineae bacterium UTCFX5]GIK28897.1 MAG: hypothetical protein BroJett007_20350 [Chloroflexota bacterium]
MNELTVVYASNHAVPRLSASALADPWAVFVPETLSDALAETIFYVPHVVVIDGREGWLVDFAQHLASVTAPSPRGHDIVVWIGGRIEDAARFPAYVSAWIAPQDIDGDALAALVIEANAMRAHDTPMSA